MCAWFLVKFDRRSHVTFYVIKNWLFCQFEKESRSEKEQKKALTYKEDCKTRKENLNEINFTHKE